MNTAAVAAAAAAFTLVTGISSWLQGKHSLDKTVLGVRHHLCFKGILCFKSCIILLYEGIATWRIS